MATQDSIHARAAFLATEPCLYQNQTTGFNPLHDVPKPRFGRHNQPDPQPNEPKSRGYSLQQYPLQQLSRQNEKFLFGQSRKFLLTAARLEGWNESR